MRKGLAYFTLLALISLPARGQSPAAHWRKYQVADGLPQENPVSISAGRHGRMWAAFPDVGQITGLDGYALTNISIPYPFRGQVYESPAGQLWTVSSNGLLEYRNDKWTEYPVPEITATLRAGGTDGHGGIPLLPVRRGNVLFLLPRALIELSVRDQGPVFSTLLAANSARQERFTGMVISSRDDTVWITSSHDLKHSTVSSGALAPESEWTVFAPPASDSVTNLTQLVEDADGAISLIGENVANGLKVILHFDGQNWQAQSPGNENVRFAWRGPDRTTWAATSNALFELDGGEAPVLNEENLARQIHDLAIEPGGSFWLATSDGLFRYSPPLWRTVVDRQAPETVVDAVTVDTAGRLWAVSPDALAMLSSNRWTRYPIPAEMRPDLAVGRSVYPLGDGTLVLPSAGGFLVFNRLSGQFRSVLPPAKTRLRAAGLMQDGTLCVQKENLEPNAAAATLEVFDGTNFSAFPYPQPPASVGDDPLMIASGGGTLWLARSKGLARFQDQRWQDVALPPDVKTSDRISCLVEVPDGRIWCGIRQAIWEYDGKAWSLSGTAGKINELFAARDGDVWAATDNGVYRYHHQVWVQNGAEEGLSSETVLSIGEDSAGRIWAGTARGLNLHVPESDPDPPYATIVAPADGNDSFSENTAITFVLTGMDKWKYTPASRLEFSYQVDGKDWSQFRKENTAPLGELPAGDHYFKVRGMDRNGNIAPTGTLYTFTVTLPWYKEARLLLISSAGGIIIVFLGWLAINRHLRLMRSHAEVEAQVALRTKQLEMANQELLHSQKMNALGTLAAGIAHDFNSILSIIKGSAQIIEDNLDNPAKIRTRANRINTVVEQGAGIVKAMLGFSRGSGGAIVMCDINAVVGETVKLLGDRFLREVEITFQPKPDLPPVPASPDFVQQILLNLIFNAAEAMLERRKIILSVSTGKALPRGMVLHPPETAQYVLISVQDFGSGIQPEIMPRIFEPFFTTKSLSARRGTGLGLSMVYELAKRMEAGLAVESVVNQGSTFTLILPVRELPVDAEEGKG